jgi:ACS family hexuronate transporter-like MFS transporter
MKSSNLLVMPADLFRARDVATVWGLFGALGSVGAAIFQAYAGWLIDNVSWTPVFMMVSVMHLVSALIVVLMIPRVEPLAGIR